MPKGFQITGHFRNLWIREWGWDNQKNVLKIHWLNWQFREQCSLLRSVTDIWDNFGFFWSSPLLVQHYCCVIKIFISGPWLLSLESSTEMKQVVRSCHAAPVFTVSVLEPHRAGRNQCVLQCTAYSGGNKDMVTSPDWRCADMFVIFYSSTVMSLCMLVNCSALQWLIIIINIWCGV